MNTLSIVIPAIGDQQQIDDTLVSVLENRPSDCEIVVVHDPSYVDPYDLGDEVIFVEGGKRAKAPTVSALISYFNAGFDQTSGRYVHTMMPGVSVEAGWCDSAIACFDDQNVGAVSPCIQSQGTRGAVCGVRYHERSGKSFVKSRKKPITAPLLGTGFFRASCLQFMRGFEARFGSYADVELGLRMKAARYKASKSDSIVQLDRKLNFRAVPGFRGGKLRGELHSMATDVGLASAGGAYVGMACEPMNGSVQAFGAVLGRLVTMLNRPSPRLVEFKRKQTETKRSRRAA